MTKKRFPKTVYVKIEDPMSADEWLHASEDIPDLAEADCTVRVGRYELVEVMEAQNKTVLVSAR